VATSTISQEAANLAAKKLDEGNNFNCINCRNCRNCRNCINCRNCTDCTDCTYCRNCTDCINCRNCAHCRNCTYCVDCRNCLNCTYCAVQPIQIISGTYLVTIRKDGRIKIGCKDFHLSVWKDESPTGISAHLTSMEQTCWNTYKTIILSLAETVNSCM